MIAGVGYPNLRDLSLGPVLVPRLQAQDWPANVELDDWSFNPIAVMQRMEERPGRYQRAILVGATERGRQPGEVVTYQWNGELPPPEQIQECVAEAAMGIISMDNLLTILEYFKVFPPSVIVIEVEPENTGWGDGFSACMENAVNEVIALLRELVQENDNG
jgi:hydrogenase maturation protease